MSVHTSSETQETIIDQLVQGLNSLVDGGLAVIELVACGQPAVEPLRRFLMEGRPSGIYQPRRWAVEALAGLGARDVLLEYLRCERPISDAVAALGEQAVRNAAASALKQWPDDEVREVLTGILKRRPLAGAVATLGELGHTPALPFIVAALEDDLCRESAEAALRNLGQAAVPELICAVLTPLPDRDEERPSSLRRRSSAARLLSEIGVFPEQWRILRPLMGEDDPGILTAAARMAWRIGTRADAEAMVGPLIAAIGRADWYFRGEIGEVLVEFSDVALPAIEREIARRIGQPPEKRVVDNVLRTLLRVGRRTREEQ